MRVSIIIPSMRRPGQLRRCVDRLIETVEGHDTEIICVIDNCLASVAALAGLPIIIVSNPSHHGAAACWNQGARLATGEAFVLGADDLWWGTGWLDAALEALETLGGDGMVGFNDGTTPAHAFATHYLVTRRYCLEHQGGVFVIPCYRHGYIDIEATARARLAARYIWAGDCHVEHRHWSNKKAQLDEVYQAGTRYKEQDRDTFRARQAAGWPNNYLPQLVELWQ